MGFNMKTWGNPVTLDANNLNRIEQGIKNSHDTLEIVSEEVSNLQNRYSYIIKELNTLIKDAPNVIETLTNISSLVQNNDISAVLSSADNFLMKKQQTLTDTELKQVYKNLELDKFLKLTSIKVNGESVVKGSEVNITLPNIDKSLDINSNNAISNAAVVKALKNINIDVEVPTKLSDLKQEVNYQTVTASEKAKWNKLEEDLKNISFTETDPTVPSWAKSPTKPLYDYVEILNTPSIPKDNIELLNGAGYITSPQATTISEDLIKKFNQSTIIPIGNKITSLEATDIAILAELSNLSPLKHKHTESDITDLQNYALKSDTEAINAELVKKSDITYVDQKIADLIGSAPETLDTLAELSGALKDNKDIVTVLEEAIATKANASDLDNYVTKTGYTMRASSTVGKFYYNTGNGEKSISVKMPTIPVTSVNGLTGAVVLGNKDVGALPDYILTINHGTAGNPRMIKFVSVNYASAATCFKMAAMTCHDNGASYQFLTDMLIAVTTAGQVTANIYKFAQSSIGNVDGVARYTGDVFYVNDTTNKIVDLYILCGQYSSSQFTPVTKVGSTTIDYVTQYSGNATYYSSGDKTWVNGCGTIYARLSDIPTNYVTTNTEQTISGNKTFTGTTSTMDIHCYSTLKVINGSNNSLIWNIITDTNGNLVFTYS